MGLGLQEAMSELFNLPPSESPRLAWMKRHGVYTAQVRDSWMAFISDGTSTLEDTEDEAIVALATANGWLLWHEETLLRALEGANE